ncbi:hypothetical protein JZ751_020415 [Albula glossodonta]|uniref:C-type lectin domain-containing protein n=1 Tax=Albula glossodonta TaxID=121402 RepID=A0A8T2N012_9TELE|nr:hypothetical protein JZ751_020415 [Albula glossodonta]
MHEFKLRWRRQPNGELFLQRKEDEEKKEGCKKPEVSVYSSTGECGWNRSPNEGDPAFSPCMSANDSCSSEMLIKSPDSGNPAAFSPCMSANDSCSSEMLIKSPDSGNPAAFSPCMSANDSCSRLCTLCSCLSRQYHFVNIERSWTEAQSYCRENYTDLATIDNQEEMEALKGVVGSGYKGQAWIGLYDDRDSWQWSLADRDFYSEGETEFRNWDSGEPNNYGGSEHCVVMRTNGKWNDASSDTKTQPFICYDGDPAQRYILIKEKKTWREAQSYCREHHTDLASVRNQSENQEIQQTAGEKAVWIGLFRESWKWSDQSSSSYRYWTSEQPNNKGGEENCAVMKVKHDGGWGDQKCSNRHPFICYEDNLVLVRENKSWDEALSYCRQHYGDLVSVSTEQLQHWVKRRAQSTSTAHVWLGLRYSCALHFWFWVSGEGICQWNWAPGDGTMECGNTGAVECGGGQQWVSLPETEKLNFICSK